MVADKETLPPGNQNRKPLCRPQLTLASSAGTWSHPAYGVGWERARMENTSPGVCSEQLSNWPASPPGANPDLCKEQKQRAVTGRSKEEGKGHTRISTPFHLVTISLWPDGQEGRVRLRVQLSQRHAPPSFCGDGGGRNVNSGDPGGILYLSAPPLVPSSECVLRS